MLVSVVSIVTNDLYFYIFLLSVQLTEQILEALASSDIEDSDERSDWEPPQNSESTANNGTSDEEEDYLEEKPRKAGQKDEWRAHKLKEDVMRDIPDAMEEVPLMENCGQVDYFEYFVPSSVFVNMANCTNTSHPHINTNL